MRPGVRRVNVSLDSLDRATFARIARADCLAQVLDGIAAAQDAGLKVKINTVALKRDNERDLPEIIRWAHQGDMDITLIETMPLGAVDEDRTDQFLPLDLVRRELESYWTLTELGMRTGGPARYVRVGGNRRQAGFHHPADPQFLRKLPAGARHLHRHLVHVPGPGRFGGFARTAACFGAGRFAQCRDRSGACRQAKVA